MQFPLIQMFHHFTNVLCMLPRGDQQSIFGFDYHQIAYAYHRDKLAWSMHVIAMRIQRESSSAINKITLGRTALRVVMLMQRSPRTEIVPAEIGRQAENIFRMFALR